METTKKITKNIYRVENEKWIKMIHYNNQINRKEGSNEGIEEQKYLRHKENK